MKVDVEPTLFAVGALIVCGDEFAAVTEKNTSRKSVKLAGQQTYPMETVEDYDQDDWATLIRACREEVKLDVNKEDIIFLNAVETRPGVELRNYVVKIPSKNLVGSGDFIDEVSAADWVSLNEVISSRGSLRFRPGVHETVADYFRHLSDPERFQPAQHGHKELVDQIPEHIYGLVEAGLTRTQAVSQYFRLAQHSLNS